MDKTPQEQDRLNYKAVQRRIDYLTDYLAQRETPGVPPQWQARNERRGLIMVFKKAQQYDALKQEGNY